MSRPSKGLAFGAVGASLAMVLAACGGGSSGKTPTQQQTAGAVSGGVLNLLGSGDVDYMDPNISYYSIGYAGLRMWSRQLYTYPAIPGKTTTAAPDLATGSPQISNGGKTYTVTMRTDAMWNTNPPRAVTAQDVVRGVKRTCNPAQPFGGLPDYETFLTGFKTFCDGFAKVKQDATSIGNYINNNNFDGVVAKDDHTVVFNLTQPLGFFTSMLTLPAFSPAPVEVLKYVPASADMAQHTLSDGPYYVASYNPTKSIDFKRNPAWKASSDPIRKAYVDEIKINETLTQDSIQQQLETGSDTADGEWDIGPPASQLPRLISSKDPNFQLTPSSSANPYVVFNQVSPNNGGALSKVAVRQAISYALNRAHMVQNGGGPQVSPPLTHILPTGIVGSDPSFDPYPNDPAKAKQMLAQAGYPNGFTIKWLYRPTSSVQSKDFATAQQDLKQVGITVTGVPVPRADFYTKYLQVPDVAKRGVWDVAEAGWAPDWYGNAALSFFGPLFSGPASYPPQGSNFGFYNNPKVLALIGQATGETDETKAASLWHQADQQVMADAAIWPEVQENTPSYHASQLHNAIPMPAFQALDFTNVWLSKDKQGG